MIPRCNNCGMVVEREGGPCARAIPCGSTPRVTDRVMCPSCDVEHDAVRVNGVLIVGCPKHPKDPTFTMMVDAEPLVCRWCRKTEAEHEPASNPNRMRARCPCLMWRENFTPGPATVAPPPREVELTDTQRLAIVTEIWRHARSSGASDGFRALYSYEDSVKERMK